MGTGVSDTRHRMRGSVSTQALRNLSASVNWDANSGGPYTITTGTDDNGDSIFNDRPVMGTRNNARLPWRSTSLRTCRTPFRSAHRPHPSAAGRAPAVVVAAAAVDGREASRSACRRRT